MDTTAQVYMKIERLFLGVPADFTVAKLLSLTADLPKDTPLAFCRQGELCPITQMYRVEKTVGVFFAIHEKVNGCFDLDQFREYVERPAINPRWPIALMVSEHGGQHITGLGVVEPLNTSTKIVTVFGRTTQQERKFLEQQAKLLSKYSKDDLRLDINNLL